LEQQGLIEYSYPYNSLIIALASRPDYAEKAIETWRKMRALEIAPDNFTHRAVLKATAHLGDVQVAYEAIQEMKAYEIPVSLPIYELLIKTYAGACKLEEISDKQIDIFIQDAWKLFAEIEQKGFKIRQNTLDSMILLYANALRDGDAEGQVMSLYQKYNIPLGRETYMQLMNMYTLAHKREKIVEIYDKFKATGMKPLLSILNMHLDAAMRLNNSDRIVESLQKIHELGLRPKRHYLKQLGQIKDLPDRIFIELQKFPRFAYAHTPRFRFTAHSFRPRNMEMGKVLKKTEGKRIKMKQGLKTQNKRHNIPAIF